MNYKDLSQAEFEDNIINEIADLCINIAWANTNFVCDECMRTLEKLKVILGCLDDEIYEETINEVDNILNN